MSDWLFTIFGWLLLLGGIFVAWRFGWRDSGKGSRRCPKCWYDMAATAGRKCPECGRESQSEKKLFRTHRKWLWIATGLALILASYPVSKWPLCQKNGPIGLVPRVATLAFLPEVTYAIDRWLPQKTPSGAMLVIRLDRVKPFDRIERFALARMIASVLKQPSRPGNILGNLEIILGYVGDQIGEVAEAMASYIDQPRPPGSQLPYQVWTMPYSDDPRMKVLAPPILRMIAAGKLRILFARDLLIRLQLWGVPSEDLRTAVFQIIANSEDVRRESDAVEFLWRENLVRPEDLERLIRAVKVPGWPFAQYAAFCAGELHEAIVPVVPWLHENMKQNDLQTVADCACLAMAMRNEALPLLPDLDRLGASRTYPTFAVCGQVAALSISGCGSDAYKLWLSALRDSDITNAKEKPLRYRIAQLVLFMNVPDEQKVQGLIELFRIEQANSVGSGRSGTVYFAIDALGKFGPTARSAVGELATAIQPGEDSLFVERVLLAIRKLGFASKAQRQELAVAVTKWRNTAQNPRTSDALFALISENDK